MNYKSLESQIRNVLSEGADRNTEARRKVVNVGRRDTADKPTSEKSKLAKNAEIMTKIIDEASRDPDFQKFLDNNNWKSGSDVKVGQSFSHGGKSDSARAGEGPYQVYQRLKTQQDKSSDKPAVPTTKPSDTGPKPTPKVAEPAPKANDDYKSGNSPLAAGIKSYDRGALDKIDDKMKAGQQASRDASYERTVPKPPVAATVPSDTGPKPTAKSPEPSQSRDSGGSQSAPAKSREPSSSRDSGGSQSSQSTTPPENKVLDDFYKSSVQSFTPYPEKGRVGPSDLGMSPLALAGSKSIPFSTVPDYGRTQSQKRMLDTLGIKNEGVSSQSSDNPRTVSGGKTQVNLNPKLDNSPGDPDKPAKAKKLFKDQSGQPVKEDQDPPHFKTAGSSIKSKLSAALNRNRELQGRSFTQNQLNKLKPKNEETIMTDNLLSEKELAAIAEIAAEFDEAKKKGTKEDANKPTIGNQRGEKGDQSGENPTNNTARYDISDEVVTEKLVGKQKKIDKNHNGKIDAEDFKLLRKEDEQVDEVSSELANRASIAAKKKASNLDHQAAFGAGAKSRSKAADLYDKSFKKTNQARKFDDYAAKKSANEEEQVTTLTADQLRLFNAVVEAEAAKRGRGRPKKSVEGDEPRPEGRDPREHIQVQAGRAMAGVPINFKHDDGSSTKLTAPMGRQITTQLNALKPAARQDAVSKIHGSASGLKDVMGIK
jgi:hypothetical protein